MKIPQLDLLLSLLHNSCNSYTLVCTYRNNKICISFHSLSCCIVNMYHISYPKILPFLVSLFNSYFKRISSSLFSSVHFCTSFLFTFYSSINVYSTHIVLNCFSFNLSRTTSNLYNWKHFLFNHVN